MARQSKAQKAQASKDYWARALGSSGQARGNTVESAFYVAGAESVRLAFDLDLVTLRRLLGGCRESQDRAIRAAVKTGRYYLTPADRFLSAELAEAGLDGCHYLHQRIA